ncbi:hypothetical protein EV426DRAFT_584495 [Tirmania nivea]|nr:hypothetical protein EV426DRAFT_584495 [Tirmania nivea]
MSLTLTSPPIFPLLASATPLPLQGPPLATRHSPPPLSVLDIFLDDRLRSGREDKEEIFFGVSLMPRPSGRPSHHWLGISKEWRGGDLGNVMNGNSG